MGPEMKLSTLWLDHLGLIAAIFDPLVSRQDNVFDYISIAFLANLCVAF